MGQVQGLLDGYSGVEKRKSDANKESGSKKGPIDTFAQLKGFPGIKSIPKKKG